MSLVSLMMSLQASQSSSSTSKKEDIDALADTFVDCNDDDDGDVPRLLDTQQLQHKAERMLAQGNASRKEVEDTANQLTEKREEKQRKAFEFTQLLDKQRNLEALFFNFKEELAAATASQKHFNSAIFVKLLQGVNELMMNEEEALRRGTLTQLNAALAGVEELDFDRLVNPGADEIDTLSTGALNQKKIVFEVVKKWIQSLEKRIAHISARLQEMEKEVESASKTYKETVKTVDSIDVLLLKIDGTFEGVVDQVVLDELRRRQAEKATPSQKSSVTPLACLIT